MNKLQATIDRIRLGQASGSEMLELLFSHPSPLVRANVAMHLPEAKDLARDVVSNALESAAQNPDHSYRLLGTTTVGHLAVASLFRIDRSRAMELVQSWPESDRQDLIWYLRSEGIEI